MVTNKEKKVLISKALARSGRLVGFAGTKLIETLKMARVEYGLSHFGHRLSCIPKVLVKLV